MASNGADRDRLAGLPPSCKCVIQALEYKGEGLPDCDGPALTRQQLLKETYLSTSTLDDALRRLENRQLVLRARKSGAADRVVAELRQSPHR